MKNKKFIIMIIAIILLASMSLIGLVACNKGGGAMTFAEGTTVDDIVKLVDDGKITSYSVKCQMFFYDEENEGDYSGYESLTKITQNMFEDYLWSVGVSDSQNYKVRCWDIIAIMDEDAYYTVTYYFDDDYDDNGEIIEGEEELEITKNHYDDEMNLNTLQNEYSIKDAILNAKSVTIKSDRIIIENDGLTAKSKNWYQAPYIEIFDINNTKIEIPDNAKNYKEVAVENAE